MDPGGGVYPRRERGDGIIPRFVAIDYGIRRIGLALSDPDGTIASPLATLHVTADAAAQIEAILRAVQDYDVDEWVVGLPLNMDGTDSEQTRRARHFAATFGKRIDQPVHLWDERLSTCQADEYLLATDLTPRKRKARRDRLAAQVILQSFLDARQAGSHGPGKKT